MIHSTAIIDKQARLGDNVSVGAYAVIGPDVEIGDNTSVGAHVVIKGPTCIGRGNRIYSFACVGEDPQDMKYAGERTHLAIGERNTIREYCTINRGTAQDRGKTTIGDDNWIMAYVHIAHDCVLGDHIIMANGASLAGHVVIEDYVGMGGFAMVHQFCRLGRHSFSGYNTGTTRDVPPYVLTAGFAAAPCGVNTTGLKRNGFTAEQIQTIRRAYKILYRSGHTLNKARNELERLAGEEPILEPLATFLTNSKRSIVR
jgi:UDP-N-acetylglucosamine acyltransferase